MRELCTAIKKITFASLCSWIKQNENGTIDFELKYSSRGNKKAEVYRIQEFDDNLIISDMGNTLAYLNEIFELSEPDVIKNIHRILRHYNISGVYNSFIYRIDPSKDAIPQISHFLRGIHFLYAMKLFYI